MGKMGEGLAQRIWRGWCGRVAADDRELMALTQNVCPRLYTYNIYIV